MKSSVTFNKNRHDKEVDFFSSIILFLYEDRRLTSIEAYKFIYLACEGHQLIQTVCTVFAQNFVQFVRLLTEFCTLLNSLIIKNKVQMYIQ